MAALDAGDEAIVKTSGGIEGAGAGGGLGLNAPGAGPKVTHFAVGGGGSKKTVTIPEEVAAIWAKILDNDDPTCYILNLYDGTGKSLEVASSGPAEGPAGGMGLNAFKAELANHTDTCGWGAFRCNAVDNRQNTISKRCKIVFVQYMPVGASAMRKAKMGTHKGTVKEIMYGAHCDVLVEDPEADLTPESLVTTLQAATGAHKPNGYEFNEGDITDADYYKDLS